MSSSPLKQQLNFHPRKLLLLAFCSIFFLLLLVRTCFYPLSLTQTSHGGAVSILTSQGSPPVMEVKLYAEPCNYTWGRWMPVKSDPPYTGGSCGTIKDGQNCMVHGRPDTGYLHWRWRPHQCRLRRFSPTAFLHLLRHKHLAFIGDSMARNQLESLLCLLSATFPPTLVHSTDDNKFRRWHFPSHNATVSVYWSPFLVNGVEKSAAGPDHNELHVDLVDDRWAAEVRQIDTVVFSVGHWFLHPAVYFERNTPLGCHYCPGVNHSEVGFYEVFRKSLRTAIRGVARRASGEKGIILTTFSPSHFEGEWDKLGACPRTTPLQPGERAVEGMDAEMRKIALEEVEAGKSENRDVGLRVEALDVTELSLMRPDGHPGPYMYANPFGNGVKERVQNDCVHWCLPGPIDTWNEILLEVMERWNAKGSD